MKLLEKLEAELYQLYQKEDEDRYDDQLQWKIRLLSDKVNLLKVAEEEPENVMKKWVTILVKLEAMKSANLVSEKLQGGLKYTEEHFMELLED